MKFVEKPWLIPNSISNQDFNTDLGGMGPVSRVTGQGCSAALHLFMVR